jgi:hypothetical protein
MSRGGVDCLGAGDSCFSCSFPVYLPGDITGDITGDRIGGAKVELRSKLVGCKSNLKSSPSEEE